MEKLKELAQQKWFQLVCALGLGITIGAVFYPQTRTEEHFRSEMKEEYALKEQELQKQHDKKVAELTESYKATESSYKTVIQESQYKLDKLTQENSTLKQSVKKRKLKIVKPDGTIVEQEVEESNTEQTHSILTQIKEEFATKVQEIENRWKKVHEERVSKLVEEHKLELEKARSENKTTETSVQKDKITEANPKKLRPEIGITSNLDVYLHGTYSIWGPVFLGGGVSGTTKSFGDGRIGVGVEF